MLALVNMVVLFYHCSQYSSHHAQSVGKLGLLKRITDSLWAFFYYAASFLANCIASSESSAVSLERLLVKVM